MTKFKPIGKMSVSQAIIDQVKTLIDSGELKPGDRFPSERQLCEQFNVGRSSVREAMITLEAMGIVERKKRMTILSSDEKKVDSQALNGISAIFTNIRDVLEARNLLEGEIILLAVERATPEDIIRIRQCVCPTKDLQAFARIDQNFHIAIAEAAHNPVLCNIYKLMLDYLFSTHNIYEKIDTQSEELIERIMREGLESHEKILEAISSGDRKLAKVALTQHLHSAELKLFSSVSVPASPDQKKTE